MPRQPAIWLDGSQALALPIPDRGLDFGDGLFETMLVRNGRLLFDEYHLERLTLGLRTLAIPDCMESVRRQLDIALEATERHPNWAVLRLSVLRGPGPRGYAPALHTNPRILIYVSHLDSDQTMMPTPANVGIADIRLATQPFLARIKHLNRLEQTIAATQAQAQGADECILLNQSGAVVSVIAGNIFLLCNGELLTPPLDTCGVEGTRRRLIIEKWAPSVGVRVREIKLSLADLKNADEVFYSNSLHTVRPIAKMNEHCWKDHSLCSALFQQFLLDIS